jgi:hypothetical protein
MKINIIRHFNLFNDIVIFGKNDDMFFLCYITKDIKKKNFLQNEACIYIKDNDDKYYCIQVTLLPASLIDMSKSINELFIDSLKKYADKIHKSLSKNSSKMKIMEKDKKFCYYLYDIPAFIWCIAVGMITADL